MALRGTPKRSTDGKTQAFSRSWLEPGGSKSTAVPINRQRLLHYIGRSFENDSSQCRSTGRDKIDGSFDWTRFLPEKWSTDGNNYYLDQPLSNYPSGTTYVVHFRNPDVAGEAVLTVRIP
ncbi:MAG: hypothetical protein IPJ71_19135 [Bdellovibrionales bacterium]|nr:hypothetical protein [Bdellovibrionales bacterium]